MIRRFRGLCIGQGLRLLKLDKMSYNSYKGSGKILEMTRRVNKSMCGWLEVLRLA
jgi:hypothetical protein